MQISRTNPIYFNLNNNYNLRPLPHRNDRVILPFNQDRPNLNHIMAAPIPQRTHVIPPKFNGNFDENANFWLQKFEAYCDQNDIDDDHKISHFILFLGPQVENWYLILTPNERDTWPHLRNSFIQRFVNPNNNIADEELFYTAVQLPNETASIYINRLLSLGNKIGLDANLMLATIKRGLLPELRAYVMSHNVNNITELQQRCQLGETIQSLSKPNTAKVHFTTPLATETKDNTQSDIIRSNNELKDVMTVLTNTLSRLHISATDNTNISQRERSQSPYHHQNNQNYQQTSQNTYHRQNQNQGLYCNYCYNFGHLANNCALLLQSTSHMQSYRLPYDQKFYNSNRSYYNRPQTNNQYKQNYAQNFYNANQRQMNRPRFNINNNNQSGQYNGRFYNQRRNSNCNWPNAMTPHGPQFNQRQNLN
jgi:hypothetical protein